MKKDIIVIDCTLRDGEQQVGVNFTYEQKHEIAQCVADSGVDYVDIMPCVHYSETNLAKELIAGDLEEKIVLSTGNRKDHIDLSKETGASKIFIFGPVSDRLLNISQKTREESLQETIETLKYARTNSLEVIGYALVDASRADFDYLVSFINAIKRYVSYSIYCDTVGCLQPNQTYHLIKDLKNQTNSKIGVHLHNNFGQANENTVQAVLAGADLISGTFTGIGEGSGNSHLEETLLSLKDNHKIVLPQICYNKIKDACAVVKRYAKIGSYKPMSKESYWVESGIHVHALLKDSLSFFPIILYNPPFKIWFGKYCGVSNFVGVFGDRYSPEKYEMWRDEIKELSINQNRSFSAEEIKKLYERR